MAGRSIATQRRVFVQSGCYHHHDESICLYAFDLIELNGDDLRPYPREGRKKTLSMCGRSIFVTPKGQCPHPRCPDWRSVGFENSTDNNAVGKHVVIVFVPIAGWAACGCAFEDQVILLHRAAPQSSSASGLTAGAAGFLLLTQSRVRPER